MYLLNEMLLMTPAVLYTGLRLGSLLRGKAGRILFGLSYLLLLPAFPLAEGLAHRNGADWTTLLITAGYDALPYLMYLVLTVVLTDLVIGLLRLTGLLSAEAIRRPRVRAIRFWSMLLVPALDGQARLLVPYSLGQHDERLCVDRPALLCGDRAQLFQKIGGHVPYLK